MYKLIFELITSPLGLPISVLWEYIILLVISEIAFQIAWKASPGGRWGSEIHWAVRIPTFIILWAITYGVIVFVKWFSANWILMLSIIGILVLIAGITTLIYTVRKQNRKTIIKATK